MNFVAKIRQVAKSRRSLRCLARLLVLLYLHGPSVTDSETAKAAEGPPSAPQAGAPTPADAKSGPVQQAPAGAAKAAASAEDAYRVVLADGATVQLVGLCEYPSAGHDWWRPDGSPLGRVPAGEAPKDVQQPMPDERPLLREVALEGTLADGADVDLNDAVTRVLGSSNSQTNSALGQRTIKRIRAVVQLERDSRTTFVVHYAAQPWTTLSRYENHDGTVLMSNGGSSYGVVFPAPSEEQGSARMVAAFDLDDLAHHEVRIIAFDKKGRKQIANGRYQGGARGVQMVVAWFKKLPLAAIGEFHFQSRKIEHVEFRNVSLHRGQKTNFAMFVEDRPYPAAPASPKGGERGRATSP
jgi:hypothetical protein